MKKILLPFLCLIAFMLTACGSVAATPTVATTSTVTAMPPTDAPPSPTSTPQLTETPAPTPTPTLGIGSTMISEKDGATLVYVPADNISNLASFWIDETEVTNAMYDKCVKAGECARAYKNQFAGGDGDNHPAVYMPWKNADAYCTWAGRRLPSEDEWLKAAVGTDGRKYPWGDLSPLNDKSFMNSGIIGMTTTEVKKYPKGVSPYGAYDMAGNAMEWTGDLYDQNTTFINPSGSSVGSKTAVIGGLLGGSYQGRPFSNNNGYTRYTTELSSAQEDFGFRCADSP